MHAMLTSRLIGDQTINCDWGPIWVWLGQTGPIPLICRSMCLDYKNKDVVIPIPAPSKNSGFDVANNY